MLLPQGLDPDSLVREEGVEGFADRIEAAQPLSDFFFAGLTENKDLNSMEECARLLTEARPHLEQMPDGFFREMMFARLAELTRGRGLDDLRNQATLKPMAPLRKTNESAKLTPLRVVIALLLQNPELAETVEQLQPEWDVLRFSGKDMLLDILHTIEVERPKNSALLIEAYRGRSWEKEVRLLVNLEVRPEGVNDFDETAEFKGAFDRVEKQGRKQYIDYLWDKKHLGKS